MIHRKIGDHRGGDSLRNPLRRQIGRNFSPDARVVKKSKREPVRLNFTLLCVFALGESLFKHWLGRVRLQFGGVFLLILTLLLSCPGGRKH